MEPQLSVLVEIDPDERRVRLVTAGHLTETNQRALYPLIRRVRRLTCDTEVVIDLTSIERLEGPALDLLCGEVEHDEPERPARPVRFALARPRPTSGLPFRHGRQAYRSGSTAWTPPGSNTVLAHRFFRRIPPAGCAASTTGPHPVTLDRAQELAAELDTRQDFLAPRGTAATTQKTASTRPAPPAG